jgi:putative ABC transport system permease protein
MYKSYFKVGWRNLLRNKGYSTINITGLAIGMAACFLIIQYVHFELSYDQFHQNSDRIYRVLIDFDNPGESVLSAANHPGTGPAMKAELPEVEQYARIVHQSIFREKVTTWSYVDGSGNEKTFNEERVYNADASFLKMFSFPFILGDPKTALDDASAVVISESVSKKFFGRENSLGKTLTVDGQRNLTVTGVFADVPENSHIKFDILVTYFLREGWSGEWNHNWDWSWPEYYTYIRLAPQTDFLRFEVKLEDFVDRHLGDITRRANQKQTFLLQPVTDIHLRSPEMTKEREVHGSERTVYFLTIIAALILIIAWINYINLSTSKSLERAKEVGLRKVAGAAKHQLISQFLFESAMVNFFATVLSFAIIIGALPHFNQLAGKNIGSTFTELPLLNEYWFWLTLIIIFIFGSVIAGLYPAFVLSSFRIVMVLKGKFFGSKSGIVLRRALVGSQFVISVALIAGTIMVFRQVTFMRSQDLGYIKDRLFVVNSPRVIDSTFQIRLETFKNELIRNSDINSVAPSSEIPGRLVAQVNIIRKFDEGPEGNTLAYHYQIDSDFFRTYGIDLIAGRNFRRDDSLRGPQADVNPVIVNEQALEALGYKVAEEAVTQRIRFGLGPNLWVGEIIGVAENHNQQSLRGGYDPIIFFPNPGLSGQYFTINLNMRDPGKIISFIQDEYKKAFQGNPFEYFFLDDYFNRQYAADQQFGKIFALFSGLALIVAGLGLFGLATFMISQRTKEIAVRKVLGATTSSMVALFSKDFVRLIIVANIVVLPVVYFIVDQWLESFSFRVNIGWIVFVVPSIVLLVISLTTVSVQTIRTSSANPVKSLRSE